MIEENYYSDTAFDSSQPVIQKPAPDKKTFAQRSADNHALKGNGVHCMEYSANQDIRVIETLNDDSADAKAEKNHPGHEYIFWSGFKNPRVKVAFISSFAGFTLFGTIICSVIFLFPNGFDQDWLEWVALSVGLPFLIYILGTTALRNNWIKDKNNTELSRRTGIVTFSWKKERVSYPFIEFDPTMQSIVDRTGMVSYQLVLMHRYTGQFCRNPHSRYHKWQVELDWEELQHYMDISKPLPDTATMEIVRLKDPTTKVWDEQNNRPKDYWKNLSEDDASKMVDLSEKHAQHFPFGQTREQAMILGWQASGIGEGDWQQ